MYSPYPGEVRQGNTMHMRREINWPADVSSSVSKSHSKVAVNAEEFGSLCTLFGGGLTRSTWTSDRINVMRGKFIAPSERIVLSLVIVPPGLGNVLIDRYSIMFHQQSSQSFHHLV